MSSGVAWQHIAILKVFDILINPLITIAIYRGDLAPKNIIRKRLLQKIFSIIDDISYFLAEIIICFQHLN